MDVQLNRPFDAFVISSAMNPDKSPLVSKLTLIVLSLILACLVLLVVRAYQRPGGTLVSSVESTEDSTIEETSPTDLDSQDEQARNSFSGNAGRAAPPRSTPAPRPAARNGGPTVRESATDANVGSTASSESALLSAVGIIDAIGNGGARGEILGFATLTGTPKPEIPIPLGEICGRQNPGQPTTRHFVVGADGGLANVLVYVRNIGDVGLNNPPAETPLLDQIGCMYEPYVMGILAGQKFRIRNSDPLLHNVHATPKLNREFNIGQPLKNQVNEKSFETPELFVRLKCDVHPWMFAYVNVMRHPFFAITDTNGFFRIPVGLPTGSYVVRAIHLKAGALTQEIVIQGEEQKTLSFQFVTSPDAQPQSSVVNSN